MITIIDPEEITKQKEIISALKEYGLNHLRKSPRLGWNYVLDHVWVFSRLKDYLCANRSEKVILDVGCGRSIYHNFLEDSLNVNILGVDRPDGFCQQSELRNVDILVDFRKQDHFDECSVDIVLWLSSIEHNRLSEIKQCYKQSMDILKRGGLFLATFALSDHTYWFEPSQQINLSVQESMEIFDDDLLEGNFLLIKNKYRENILRLRDKYKRRYGGFKVSDPEFLSAGVEKVKT